MASNHVGEAGRLAEAAAAPVPETRNTQNRAPNEEYCIVCLTGDATTKMAPCGRARFCEDCAGLTVAGAVGDPPKRPFCRAAVTRAVQATCQNIDDGAHERPPVSTMMEELANVLLFIPSGTNANAVVSTRSSFAPTALPARRPNIVADVTNLGVGAASSSEAPRRMASFVGPRWPSGSSLREYVFFSSNLALPSEEVGLMPDTGAHDG
eukprot:1406385-Pyramimonas_sp.AAC.1